MQGAGVTLQAVVADRQCRLRVALVPKATHAQRRRPRQAKRAAFTQGLQFMVAPFDEAAAQRRRGAEQQQQHEGMAPEVADEPEVGLVVQPGQRPVVVDAGDRLHAAPVAVAQAHAVDALGAADVAAAVGADGNVLVGRQSAGHAAHPQRLVADRAVDELVDLGQLAFAAAHVGVRAGDQLELRLAVVGGDARVGQCRTQGLGVRGQRQAVERAHAQAFLLDAAAHGAQPLRRDRVQSRLQGFHGQAARGRRLGAGAAKVSGLRDGRLMQGTGVAGRRRGMRPRSARPALGPAATMRHRGCGNPRLPPAALQEEPAP
jgi:hypothetical protein